MIDWDDLAHGPVAEAFAEEVLYRPSSGAPITVSGVFDEAYAEVADVDGQPVSSVFPALGVRLSDFGTAEPDTGDRLTIIRTGATYAVNNVNPDGHGWAILPLNWVSG
ncbi:hypothetical protein GAY28_07355 [Azospirillum brasilense]|nr:hypothetical protein [Azospirillum brasilense]